MTNQAQLIGLRPALNAVEAQLFVADIEASCDFYTEKLGFTVVFIYGDPAFYAQVSRDRVQLNLKVVAEPVFAGDVREREQLLSASITVTSSNKIEQLFNDFQAAGVTFSQTLMTQPWGAINFTVRDPDGNLILFASAAE